MFRRPETKATEEKVYKQERIGEFMTTWKDFPRPRVGGLGGAQEGRLDGDGQEHALHAAVPALRHAQHSQPVARDSRER